MVQREEDDFGFRRVALPRAAAEIVANTARADNPIHFKVYYAENERYLMLVDGGKCARPYNASVLFVDARGQSADTPYLLQCVPGLPEDPNSHNAIWALSALNGTNYIGAYSFDGIFQWDRSEHLGLDVFSARGLLPVANAARADLNGTFAAGSNILKIDLSTLAVGNINLGATEIVPSPNADQVAFFKSGTGSGQTDQNIRLFDRKTMEVNVVENTTKEYFDYITDVIFSPDGSLLLTTKSVTGYELFRVSDLKRATLPPGVLLAQFSMNDQLRLTLANSRTLIWHVPESVGNEIGFLAGLLKAKPRD